MPQFLQIASCWCFVNPLETKHRENCIQGAWQQKQGNCAKHVKHRQYSANGSRTKGFRLFWLPKKKKKKKRYPQKHESRTPNPASFREELNASLPFVSSCSLVALSRDSPSRPTPKLQTLQPMQPLQPLPPLQVLPCSRKTGYASAHQQGTRGTGHLPQ